MVLALNIGNTNFMLGFKADTSFNTSRYPSRLIKSKDDFIQVISRFVSEMCEPEKITGVVLASVNPYLTECLENAVRDLFNISPLIISPSLNMKLDTSNYDTSLIGSDRICVSEAAISKYSLPIAVFDFGTATTINIIDKNGCFIGGSILTGLMMGVKALAKDTAQLPLGELDSNNVLIGRNTKECIISGAIYGNAAMLDGMVSRIENFFCQKTNIIMTGGNATYIAPICRTEVIHEPDLLIDGLYLLYNQNI